MIRRFGEMQQMVWRGCGPVLVAVSGLMKAKTGFAD